MLLVTWEDIRWLKRLWTGPIVVKGVLTADDAKRAVDEGAAAIVVSNHGGRQLDGASSHLESAPGGGCRRQRQAKSSWTAAFGEAAIS